MPRRYLVLVAVVTVALLVPFAVSRAADDRGHATALEQITPAQASSTSTTAVPAVQSPIASQFPIFRSQPSSPIPSEIAEQIGSPQRFGRNSELARRLDTPWGTGWVVPGDGYLCLAVPSRIDGYGTSCTTVAVAVKQGLWLRLSDEAGRGLDTYVLPDRTDVELKTPSGAKTLVANRDGVVTQILSGGESDPTLVPAK